MVEVGALLSFTDFPVATDEGSESLRGQLKSLKLKEFLLNRENPPARYYRDHLTDRREPSKKSPPARLTGSHVFSQMRLLVALVVHAVAGRKLRCALC